jgi:hypothetical protein
MVLNEEEDDDGMLSAMIDGMVWSLEESHECACSMSSVEDILQSLTSSLILLLEDHGVTDLRSIKEIKYNRGVIVIEVEHNAR